MFVQVKMLRTCLLTYNSSYVIFFFQLMLVLDDRTKGCFFALLIVSSRLCVFCQVDCSDSECLFISKLMALIYPVIPKCLFNAHVCPARNASLRIGVSKNKHLAFKVLFPLLQHKVFTFTSLPYVFNSELHNSFL